MYWKKTVSASVIFVQASAFANGYDDFAQSLHDGFETYAASAKASLITVLPAEDAKKVADANLLVENVDAKLCNASKSPAFTTAASDGKLTVHICPSNYVPIYDLADGAAYALTYFSFHPSAGEEGWGRFVSAYSMFIQTQDYRSVDSKGTRQDRVCLPYIYLFLYAHNQDADKCNTLAPSIQEAAHKWVYEKDEMMPNAEVVFSAFSETASPENVKAYIDASRSAFGSAAYRSIVFHEFGHVIHQDVYPGGRRADNVTEESADKFAIEALKKIDDPSVFPADLTAIFLTLGYFAEVEYVLPRERVAKTVDAVQAELRNLMQNAPPELKNALERLYGGTAEYDYGVQMLSRPHPEYLEPLPEDQK